MLKIVEDSRFIASTDLYLIDGRCRRDLQGIVKQLRRNGRLPIVSSIGRLNLPTFYPPKTYVYGAGRRGHLLHWLYVAHMRGLFEKGARELAVPLEWKQHAKQGQNIPDAEIRVAGEPYLLEVDNSTEGLRLDRLAGRVRPNSLIVAFRSEERFQNLSGLGGRSTFHGYFHDKEDSGFNILTEPIWWNGGLVGFFSNEGRTGGNRLRIKGG